MPINKKQVIRLIKFVSELRCNNYPNTKSFLGKLRDAELYENLNILCSERTFMRDVDVLRNDFKAPIDFSKEHNGYFLKNEYWEFQVPVLEENFLISSMLGARLAEDIMPSPVKEKIRTALNEELTSNNSEFFNRTFLESLLIAAGTKTSVDPEIFHQVFGAWSERRVLNLTYKKGTSGEISERTFEPHIIAYHKGNWYTKGIDQESKKTIVLAIFRIQQAQFGKVFFQINKELLADTKKNGLFDYPKIENIKVKCSVGIAYYLYEQKQAKKLTITPQKDGSLIVILPPSPEQEAIRWILGEGGNVEVLEPLYLRQKVHQLAIKLTEVNQV